MKKHTLIMPTLAATLFLSTGLTVAAEPPQIYGSQLMSQQEMLELHERMRNAKTAEEREQIRNEQHQQMQTRAKARGFILADEPPVRGSGSGRGMGPGYMGPGYMSPGNMGPGHMGSGYMSPGNMGPGYMGPRNMNPGYMGPGYMGPRNMNPGYMGPGYMGPGYMSPGNMGPGYMEPGYMNPGNMGPGYMRRGYRNQ